MDRFDYCRPRSAGAWVGRRERQPGSENGVTITKYRPATAPKRGGTSEMRNQSRTVRALYAEKRNNSMINDITYDSDTSNIDDDHGSHLGDSIWR